MNAKKIFLLATCLFLPFLLYASLEQNFKKMNMQNGLAGNSVYSILRIRTDLYGSEQETG